MARKYCGDCEKFRALSSFHRRGSKHQSICKKCRKRRDEKQYKAHAPRLIEAKKAYKAQVREWCWQIKKAGKCNDCGRNPHPAAMTFDHLPGETKLGEISSLIYKGSKQRAEEEMKKCQLVCANCHAIRTYERRRVAQG